MEIKHFTENTIAINLSSLINEKVNQRLVVLRNKVEKLAIKGVTELVTSYTSLIIYFDVMETDGEQVITALKQIDFYDLEEEKTAYRLIEIPVCYGGEFGSDIESFETNGLSTKDVIDLHSSKPYLVYMVGFMPGFPYLGGLDERLYKDRLKVPRKAIPAGSVGIGGQQTGIYPFTSPGGWNLLGKTPVRLYDHRRGDDSILYRTGDYIKFTAIDKTTYSDIQEQVDAGTYAVNIVEGEGEIDV